MADKASGSVGLYEDGEGVLYLIGEDIGEGYAGMERRIGFATFNQDAAVYLAGLGGEWRGLDVFARANIPEDATLIATFSLSRSSILGGYGNNGGEYLDAFLPEFDGLM